MNTPALLTRTALYALLGQALVILVLSIAVPDGASILTLIGFVTPYYESNFLSAHITPIPFTDPTVYVSVQSAAQMLVVALAIAGVVGLVKTNPWQHGVLPDSTPPPRPASPPPAAGPPSGGASPGPGAGPGAGGPRPGAGSGSPGPGPGGGRT